MSAHSINALNSDVPKNRISPTIFFIPSRESETVCKRRSNIGLLPNDVDLYTQVNYRFIAID